MSTRLSDERIREIVDLRKRGISIREIGKALGIAKSTVSDVVSKYIHLGGMKGEPPPGRPLNTAQDKTDIDGSVDVLKLNRPATVEEIMEMCKLDPRVWIPYIFRPNTWQGYYKLKDGTGHKKVQLFQSKAVFKRVITEELEHAILHFVRDNVRPLPKPKISSLKGPEDGYMLTWGMWDAHIGMYAWHSEVGKDYDVKIGVNRMKNSVDDIIEELKPYNVSRILMPIGNDFMHFDSVRHTTAFGEHFLDTDTRYAKVYLAALDVLVYMVERATEICDNVELLYIPGNHDVTSSFTLTVALAQRFLNDPRVVPDLSMNPRKYRTHGGTLIGFDHGYAVKPDQLQLIFSEEAKEHWSDSTYREVQIGDKHQRWEKVYQGVIPTNGVLIRRNPCLCNTDSWHHRKGLVGEPVKSVEAWRYDKIGYRGSHVAWARDDAR
jgi:transposase